MDTSKTKDKINILIDNFKAKEAVLIHTITEQQTKVSNLTLFIETTTSRLEVMRLAQIFLQELVDNVSSKNIKKINNLVNSALKLIFYDELIEFEIKQKIKRNVNTYIITLSKDGVEGSVNAFGGGVIAVVALVLKILFNFFSHSHPLLILDESLSFLSDKYIPKASSFINELSSEFKTIILLVTHQVLFAKYAGSKYFVEKESPTSSRIVSVNNKEV